MSATPLAAVVMAAGLGTRMRSKRPKHLHAILGRRLVDWIIAAARPVGACPLVLVTSPEAAGELEAGLSAPAVIALQERPLGTGDAVACARPALEGFDGDLLVLAGDTPLVTGDLLERLVLAHRAGGAAATVLSFEPADPGGYGRIVRGDAGILEAIVEAADATAVQLEIREVNSSIYVFRVPLLWDVLARMNADNVQGELYLTDAVRILVEADRPVSVYKAPDPQEVEGVNTRAELARAAAGLRDRIVGRHLAAGVTVVDPLTTWIDDEVEIEADAVIHPFTVLRGRSRIGAGAEVGPHVVAVDAEIAAGVTVGPFAYLRPGARLAEDSRAGTFVEIKNSTIGRGAKVPHLSYIGDADVGEGTNIGAGAITANYRPELGAGKQRTRIGSDVHTGSHNVFVAPVEIGDGAWIGAGSTITEDVPAGALAIARARQVVKRGYGGGERDE